MMRKSKIEKKTRPEKRIFRYRRTYDSEYSAPLVAFYTWPALMDGKDCVAKGEAHTKRGAVRLFFTLELTKIMNSSCTQPAVLLRHLPLVEDDLQPDDFDEYSFLRRFIFLKMTL